MNTHNFVRVENQFINLSSIRYADWYKEEPQIILYFETGEPLTLTGDAAIRMATILDRMAG